MSKPKAAPFDDPEAAADAHARDLGYIAAIRTSMDLTRAEDLHPADATGVLLGGCMELVNDVAPTQGRALMRVLLDLMDARAAGAPPAVLLELSVKQATAAERYREESAKGASDLLKVLRELMKGAGL